MAGVLFGPDITFLGVPPRCNLTDESSYADADIVILGAPRWTAAPATVPAPGSDRLHCVRRAICHRTARGPASHCGSTA